MFARVSTYRAPDADRLLEGFESVRGGLEGMEGFSHAYFLVDRSSGKGMSITMWESEEALRASAASADEMRRRGTELGGGSIESVENFEVGMSFGRPAVAR